MYVVHVPHDICSMYDVSDVSVSESSRCKIHTSKFKIPAPPFKTQCKDDSSLGNSTATTKFVLVPVVDKLPALAVVLYTGVTYVPG